MGDNALFWWFDYWGPGTIYEQSSQAANFPATNTQNQALSKPWRTTGDDDEYVRCDFGKQVNFGGLVIVGDNSDDNGRIAIQASNASNFSTTLLPGTYAYSWQSIFGAGEEPDGAGSEIVGAGGVPLAATKLILPSHVFTYIPSASVSARYVEARFRNATNPDGYIQVPYIIAGLVKEVSITLGPGFRLSRQEEVVRTAAGSGERRVRSLYRRVLFESEFSFQTDTEAKDFWLLATRHLGVSRGFGISILRPGNPIWKFLTTYFCRFETVAEPEYRSFDDWAVKATLLELVGA